MKRGIRNANIGIAASAIAMLIGFAFLHGSERGMEALGVGGLAVALGVLFLLEWRDERAQEKTARRSR